MDPVCPLCHDPKRFANPKKRKILYGHPVCKKCYYGFANRRQLAYAVDTVFLYFLGGFFMFSVSAAIVGLDFDSNDSVAPIGIMCFYLVFIGGILIRDAFRGRSVGKAICGVRTIVEKTGVPCGLKSSLMRSLPLFLPIVPIIIAFQLQRGHRWGDRWAGTRVIWRKHADSPVFSPAAALGQVFE